MNPFSFVRSRADVADAIGIQLKLLTYILFVKRIENCYSTFLIPKKSGGNRTICSPCDELKLIQKKLADALWEQQQDIWKKANIHPNLSHGFEKGKSIFSNAKIHVNRRFVLNIDLENFFDTFHFGRVCGFFEKNRYFMLPHEAAVTIAQIACYNSKLPQGSPCSPIITNMICQALDIRLLQVAKKYKLDYTRYADDLTFSTNNRHFLDCYERFYKSLLREIQHMGFSVNETKTRLLYRNSRQTVTGLTVNQKININCDYYKATRAMAHSLYQKNEFQINGSPATINQLEGRFAFIDQIDHFNNRKDTFPHNARNLNRREREYQAFLYYKYFFTNDRVLIFTEGKTDVLYLKAALMALNSEYPNLVQRDEAGKFLFNVSFFKRSKRWRYLYMISPDGADTFGYLLECIRDTKGAPPNYNKYFERLSTHRAHNPVVLLFDNERSSDRPLGKIIRNIKLLEQERRKLDSEHYCRVIPNANFYILTFQLPPGMVKCEIEDLFPNDVLQTVINGKTFDRHIEKGDSMHYGKNDFSRYVFSNYQKIDFSAFRPLLNTLNKLIDEYKAE